MTTAAALSRFRKAYAAHRAAEGRGHAADELLALPYLQTGPFAKQWAVRARTFDAFVRRIVEPLQRTLDRPLRLLDLGAGNGWLCRRIAQLGGEAVALDLRDDHVDGLGAAWSLIEAGARFERVAASFDALPLREGYFDVVAFNASLHYALDLAHVLSEARCVVRPGGRVAILDSPFYAAERDGLAMVDEKRRDASARFGARADALLSLPFVEFLTKERLLAATREARITWRRHRVVYPLWYEMRPLVAALRGRRAPSRFDLWEGIVE